MLTRTSLQDHRVKQLKIQLLALKASTSAAPLMEHVITAPHLPRHIFVLASPVTIGEVVRRLSLPFPRVIPRHEWGNSLDAVPWTQHRKYPLGSFVKILKTGPYYGDIGYVMAIDFKDDSSASASVPWEQFTIVSKPQAVVIAVVPRIRVKRSQRPRTRLEGDARSLAIDEEISAAFRAESLHLEKVVQTMHEQARVVSFCKGLMKEKDDLVWSHVQTKKEIEKEVADLVDRNTKSKKDLEKELRVASSLRKSIIKEELEGLRNEIALIQQHASERIASENLAYEHQLVLIRDRIDAIQLPADLPRIREPK